MFAAKKLRRWNGLAVLLLAGAAIFARPVVTSAAAPRLVVMVSVDQLPFEYLLRMRKGFADDGLFRTVWEKGAVFTACHHGQAFTITGPGHSVFLSGAFPNTTGIVDNDWFDRSTGKTMYCVDDAATEVVGAAGAKSM